MEVQPQNNIFQTAIAVPLLVDRNQYGVMLLFYHNYRNISDEENDLASTVGEQVVLAVENAQLHLQSEDLARLQERQRIAQALHDTVAQMLFSLGMEVDKVKNITTVDASFEQSMKTIRRLAARSSYELRSAIFALREGKKKRSGSGVVDLIEEVVAEFRTQSKIAITCIAPPEVPNLLPNVTEAIYRIVRESLSNISKHAKATAVIVTLSLDKQSVHIMIQDDGVGLTEWASRLEDGERQLHFGVASMRQLTIQAHGQFTITNGDDQGVLIKASFPLSEEAKNNG